MYIPTVEAPHLKLHTTTTCILIIHQLLCMLSLLHTCLLEELRKPRQRDVVPVEEGVQGMVYVRNCVLDVYLLINSSLALRVVVETSEAHSGTLSVRHQRQLRLHLLERLEDETSNTLSLRFTCKRLAWQRWARTSQRRDAGG